MIVELHESFETLAALLSKLQDKLSSQNPTHWLPLTEQEETQSNSITVLSDLLADLWYKGNQDGRETKARHGIVLAYD